MLEKKRLKEEKDNQMVKILIVLVSIVIIGLICLFIRFFYEYTITKYMIRADEVEEDEEQSQ